MPLLLYGRAMRLRMRSGYLLRQGRVASWLAASASPWSSIQVQEIFERFGLWRIGRVITSGTSSQVNEEMG